MTVFKTFWSSTYLLVLGTNFVRGVLGCPPSEYQVLQLDTDCCPKCGPGTCVKADCTNIRSTSCHRCVKGTFMNDYNGERECFPCRLCSPDLGLKTLTSCTAVQDTTCEPLDGFFCVNGTENHCTAAKKHRRCQPGQYIRNNGTAATDTECSDCTPGTFSDGTLTVCQPHTQCEQVNLSTVTEGTTSTDAQCGENKVPVVVGGVIGGITLLTLTVVVVLCMKKNRRKFTEKARNLCHHITESTPENKKDDEELKRDRTEGHTLIEKTSVVTNHSHTV